MDTKLGLVLSGGGAKGAYQAGILKYMAEVDMQPAMVSGTSIGALNASIVSSKKDIKTAALAVNDIWEGLSNNSPLKLGSGVVISAASVFMSFSSLMKKNFLGKLVEKVFDSENGALSDAPLYGVLENHASVEDLKSGLPLYVSLYPSDGASEDIVKYLGQICLGTKGKVSVFKKVQELKESDFHNAILASASLPYLFKPRSIEGKKYRDGGMGGAFRQQGNTPAQPLVAAGCTHLVVSLLEDGSFFDRHDPLYKDVAIIEVRPKGFISTSAIDMLAFTPNRISHWKKQGYEDAERCIGDCSQALSLLSENRQSQDNIQELIHDLENDEFKIT